jgi:hypothetical protein
MFWSLTAAAIVAGGALVYVLVWPGRRHALTLRWVLAFLLLGEFLVGMALFEFAQWIGRYFLPLAALAGALLPILFPPHGRAANVALLLVTLLASLQATEVLLNNGRKPLLPSPAILNAVDPPVPPDYVGSILQISRERRRLLVRPSVVRLAWAADDVEPPIRRMGILSRDGDIWDFVYFGPDLRRELVVLDAKSDWWRTAADAELEHIVCFNVPVPDGAGYVPVAGNWPCQLLERTSREDSATR